MPEHTKFQSLSRCHKIQPHQFIMEELLGPQLMSKTGDSGSYELGSTSTQIDDEKELVLLYFSAHWCPPCRGFTPVLGEFYEKYGKDLKFEVVFISSDRTDVEFNEYYGGSMPKWLALSRDSQSVKQNLTRLLQVRGIPMLAVFNAKTGEFLTNQGRGDIQGIKMSDAAAAEKVINGWKAMEGVALS